LSSFAEELAQALEAEGAKTLDFFNNLTSGQWESSIYSEGPGWRVHNLLAHFVEVEGSIPQLIRSIVEGDPASPRISISTAGTQNTPARSAHKTAIGCWRNSHVGVP
jgi:hypothetical protein